MRATTITTGALLAALALAQGPGPAAAGPASGPFVAIYGQGVALIQEVATIRVAAGVSEISLPGIPSQVHPSTLMLEDVTPGARPLVVLGQELRADTISAQALIERAVGRVVRVRTADQEWLEARLLALDGPLFQTPDGYRVVHVSEWVFPPEIYAAAGLATTPSLVWTVRAEEAGDRQLRVTYLAGGLSWSAAYALRLDASGERAALTAWAQIGNESGRVFQGARVRLVAGQVSIEGDPDAGGLRSLDRSVAPAVMEAAPEFVEQGFAGRRIYDLDTPANLRDRTTTQLALFTPREIGVRRVLMTQAAFSAREWRSDLNALIVYLIDNVAGAGLGLPLPGGVMSIYGEVNGAPVLLGQSRLRDLAVEEEARLPVGVDFDVRGDREQSLVARGTATIRSVDSQGRVSLRPASEWRIEVTLTNPEDRPVALEHHEGLPGGLVHEIRQASRPHRTEGGMAIWELTVPARGQVTLSFVLAVEDRR